jgi:Protein of unknown function (DUF3159)
MTSILPGDIQSAEQSLPDGRQIIARLGGVSALVDGAVPPLVFVTANAVVRSSSVSHLGIWPPAAAALLAALGLVGLRLIRGESKQGAFRGLGILAATVGFAAATGEAKDMFLPGIYVDALYGSVLFASVLVRRPAIGYLYGFLFDRLHSWRGHPRLRRVLTLASVGWAAIYAARYSATVLLYRADEAELLAVTKLLLGWPVTALGAIATIAAVRRAIHVAGP